MIATLRGWLTDPSISGFSPDDPGGIDARRSLIHRKRFLHRIYEEWYGAIVRSLPPGDDPVVEVGSGSGFLGTLVPGLVTSEIIPCRDVRIVLDAERLPFQAASLRAVVMTNVLHHLSHPSRFFADAGRCVRPGGGVIMIEPWVSRWSRVMYSRFHHEPFDAAATAWEQPVAGPLSGANQAIPWILFDRDRARFESEFPEWAIDAVRPFMPFRYLLSGGVTLRSLMPASTFNLWRGVERVLGPWMSSWAMFAEIRLSRRR